MPLASAFPAGRLAPPAHTRSTAASRGREREPIWRGAAATGKRAGSEPRSRSVPSGGADRAWLENLPERELESLYSALRASSSSGAAPPPPAAPDALTPLRPRTPPRREGALRSSDLTGVSHSSPGAYPRREERPPPGSAPPPAWRSLSPPARPATGLAARATEAVLAERRLAVNDALATAGAARARLEERLEAPLPMEGSGGARARRELFAGLRFSGAEEGAHERALSEHLERHLRAAVETQDRMRAALESSAGECEALQAQARPGPAPPSLPLLSVREVGRPNSESDFRRKCCPCPRRRGAADARRAPRRRGICGRSWSGSARSRRASWRGSGSSRLASGSRRRRPCGQCARKRSRSSPRRCRPRPRKTTQIPCGACCCPRRNDFNGSKGRQASAAFRLPALPSRRLRSAHRRRAG